MIDRFKSPLTLLAEGNSQVMLGGSDGLILIIDRMGIDATTMEQIELVNVRDFKTPKYTKHYRVAIPVAAESSWVTTYHVVTAPQPYLPPAERFIELKQVGKSRWFHAACAFDVETNDWWVYRA